MAKNFFFVPGIVFFWVNNPREVKEFVSNTVVLSLVFLVRSLTMLLSKIVINRFYKKNEKWGYGGASRTAKGKFTVLLMCKKKIKNQVKRQKK